MPGTRWGCPSAARHGRSSQHARTERCPFGQRGKSHLVSVSWHPTSNGAGLYGWSKKTRFSAQLGHFAARPETSCLRQRAKILVGESSCLALFQAKNTSICAVFRAQNPKAKMSPSLPYNPVPLLAGPLYRALPSCGSSRREHLCAI